MSCTGCNASEWYNSNFVPWINAYWVDKHCNLDDVKQDIQTVEDQIKFTSTDYPTQTTRQEDTHEETLKDLANFLRKLKKTEHLHAERKEYIENFDWVDWEIKFTEFLGDTTACFGIRDSESWLELMQKWYRAMTKHKGNDAGVQTHGWR